jgi:hypothetical protein
MQEMKKQDDNGELRDSSANTERRSPKSVKFAGREDEVPATPGSYVRVEQKPKRQIRRSMILTEEELEKIPRHSVRNLVMVPEEDPSYYDVIPRMFPRLYAVCFYIILPLWFLIFLSVGGGYWLASFEAPNEIEANDVVLRSQFLQEDLDGSGNQALDYLLDLPSLCFEKYLEEQAITDTNYSLSIMVALTNEDIPTTGLLQATSQTLSQILLRLALCATDAEISAERVAILRKAIEDEAVSGDLTFNWIRCWNQTELGTNTPLRPTAEHLEAAANQSEFYTEEWEADRARITSEYLENVENVTAAEIGKARQYGIDTATGGNDCNANSAGTSWFWFTVMTTVGK